MLKKFFVAVIMCLLVISSQIAVAEDYDWSQATRISSKAQLARYIENERRRVDTKHPLGQTEIHFVLINFKLSLDEEIAPKELRRLLDEYFSSVIVPESTLIGVRGTGQLTYVIRREYPGTHVANAYLSNNQQQAWMNLTNEEQKLYNIAVGIVDEANKRSSEREKARYIHKVICDRACYPDDKSKITHENAIGALVIGITECEGYTDAFYMLSRMSGLNVCRISGSNQGEPHAWNFITFSDGKSYCVDVTNGFFTKSDYLFCATKERMEKTHSCEWEIIPNLQ